MSKNSTQLRRSIMRRIYYAYAVSVVAHPMTLQGMALALALAIFARQVHVASVFNNVLTIQVGQLPQFVGNAFMRGEVLTIFAVGVIVFVGLSVPWRVVRPTLGRTLMTP